MKKILFLILMTVTAFPSFSQALFSENVPLVINDYLYRNYPGAEDIESGISNDGYYSSSFVHDDKDVMLVFDPKGNLIEKQTEMTQDELPLFVYYMLRDNYKLQYASKVEKATGDIYYILEMRKRAKIYEFTYDVEGNPTTDVLMTKAM